MQTSQKHRSAGIHGFYHQPVQEIDPYGLSHIQILDKNMYSDAGSQGTSISFETCLGQFFTLESSSATAGFVVYDSPAASISSNRSPFSSQGSHSCISDPRHSPENIYGSPLSGSSSADDSNILRQKLRELEISLLGPESDITDSGSFCFVSGGYQAEPYASWDWKQMMEMIPSLDLKHVLLACADAVSNADIQRAAGLMHVLDQMVSVSGEPLQRLGAYMLEGLRARLELSGTHARGGGLDIVGQRLSKVAESCNVPFEFHDVAMDGSEVQLEHLRVQPGEAVVVNFPYVLHHMPDESVDTWNHRDRLIRMVKSLSPKIVTLVEQESNTNTKPFFPRFIETLDYYAAMFESIAAGGSVDVKQRINAEQQCVARDIVNMIACEEAERVERHELLAKWRSRFTMAGFNQYPLGSSATAAVKDLLKEYHRDYSVQERDWALYLRWRDRDMATSSAWR
ncbi:hypothetical protein D5086_011950 [Populus alba]|uniref:Uncharacterized protein n=1 Tax=Populus alba TaxID=43335 RepID=A0ACC4C1J1_POPAL